VFLLNFFFLLYFIYEHFFVMILTLRFDSKLYLVGILFDSFFDFYNSFLENNPEIAKQTGKIVMNNFRVFLRAQNTIQV